MILPLHKILLLVLFLPENHDILGTHLYMSDAHLKKVLFSLMMKWRYGGLRYILISQNWCFATFQDNVLWDLLNLKTQIKSEYKAEFFFYISSLYMVRAWALNGAGEMQLCWPVLSMTHACFSPQPACPLTQLKGGGPGVSRWHWKEPQRRAGPRNQLIHKSISFKSTSSAILERW